MNEPLVSKNKKRVSVDRNSEVCENYSKKTKDKSKGSKLAQDSISLHSSSDYTKTTSTTSFQKSSSNTLLRSEAEFLVQSNLLKLQTDELINEMKKSSVSILDNSIESIKSLLLNYDNFPKDINKKWFKKNQFKGIELDQYHDIDINLNFIPPKEIIDFGSYSLGALANSFPIADLLIKIPSECFEEKDLLNYVYFNKRRLYLSVIGSVLLKSYPNLCVEYLLGDVRKPILVLKLGKNERTILRLIPCLDPTTFRLNRLLPNKNNIRPYSWLKKLKESDREEEDGGGRHEALDPSQLDPTPSYNLAIFEDIALPLQQRYYKEAIKKCPVLVDTILLLKIWWVQSQPYESFDSMVDMHLIAIVCHLYHIGKIYFRMTSLNGFNVCLQFLSNDLKSGEYSVSFLKDDCSSSDEFNKAINDAAEYFKFGIHLPVSVSGSGAKDETKTTFYNLLWRISSNALIAINLSAKNSRKLLDELSDRAFDSIFMRKVKFLERHDMIFYLPSTSPEMLWNANKVNSTPVEYLLNESEEILSRALNGRITSLRIASINSKHFLNELNDRSTNNNNSSSTSNHHCWMINSPPLNHESFGVMVSISLNKDGCSRRVEKEGEDVHITTSQQQQQQLQQTATMTMISIEKENSRTHSKNFKEFWGENKITLRRFQDGSIKESLVWEANDEVSGLGSVIAEIVNHCVERFLPEYYSGKVKLIQNQLEAPLATYRKMFGISRKECKFLSAGAIREVDELRSILSSKLTGMPLIIESVSASSPYLRYTSLLPTAPNEFLMGGSAGRSGHMKIVVPPLTLICSVESSGKWPSDMQAIRKTKLTLLLKINKLLQQQFEIESVVREELHALDIAYKGYLFRIHINQVHENEITGSELSQQAIVTYFVSPLHHTYVHTLSTQHLSYSECVSLCLYWLHTSMFSDQMSQETVELLVAYIYKKSLPNAPVCPSSGFISFLKLLSEHSWGDLPLFVDFSDDQDPKVPQENNFQSEALTKFEEMRRTRKHEYAMFVTSSAERYIDFASAYSRTHPENVVLKMISNEARKTYLDIIRFSSCHLVSGDNSKSYSNMLCKMISNHQGGGGFTSNANIILYFNKKLLKNNRTDMMTAEYESIKIYKNLNPFELSALNHLICSDDSPYPIQRLTFNKIRNQLRHLALVFWDQTKGDKMYLIWRPKAFLPEKFSILNATHKFPIHLDYSTIDDSENNTPAKTKNKLDNSSKSSHSHNTVNAFCINVSEIVTEIIHSANGAIEDVEFI